MSARRIRCLINTYAECTNLAIIANTFLFYRRIRVCAGAGPRYRYDRLRQLPYTALNATTANFAYPTPLMMSWSGVKITFRQKRAGARQNEWNDGSGER